MLKHISLFVFFYGFGLLGIGFGRFWLSPPKAPSGLRTADQRASDYDEPDPREHGPGQGWASKASPQLEMQLLKQASAQAVEQGLRHSDSLNHRNSSEGSDTRDERPSDAASPPPEIVHDLLHELPVQPPDLLARNRLEIKWAEFNKTFMEPTFGGKQA